MKIWYKEANRELYLLESSAYELDEVEEISRGFDQ